MSLNGCVGTLRTDFNASGTSNHFTSAQDMDFPSNPESSRRQGPLSEAGHRDMPPFSQYMELAREQTSTEGHETEMGHSPFSLPSRPPPPFLPDLDTHTTAVPTESPSEPPTASPSALHSPIIKNSATSTLKRKLPASDIPCTLLERHPKRRGTHAMSQFLDLEAEVSNHDDDDDDDAISDGDADFIDDAIGDGATRIRRQSGRVADESADLHQVAAAIESRYTRNSQPFIPPEFQVHPIHGRDYLGATLMVQAAGEVTDEDIDAFGVPLTGHLPDIADPAHPTKAAGENEARRNAQQSALRHDPCISMFRQATLANLPLWEIQVWPRHEGQAVRWIKKLNQDAVKERRLDPPSEHLLNPWRHPCARGRIWFTARFMQDVILVSQKLPWRVPNRPTRRVAASATDSLYRWILQCEAARVKSALHNQQQKANEEVERRRNSLLPLEDRLRVRAEQAREREEAKRRASIPNIYKTDSARLLECAMLQAGAIVAGSEVVVTAGEHLGTIGIVEECNPISFIISTLVGGVEHTVAIERRYVRLHFALGQWVRVLFGKFRDMAGWVVDVQEVPDEINLKAMDGVNPKDEGAVFIMCVQVPEGSECVVREVYGVHPFVVSVDDDISYPDKNLGQWAQEGINWGDDAPLCVDNGKELIEQRKAPDIRIGRHVVIRLGKYRRSKPLGSSTSDSPAVVESSPGGYSSPRLLSPSPLPPGNWDHMISPQSPSPSPESVDDDSDSQASSRRRSNSPPYNFSPLWSPSSPPELFKELDPTTSASASQSDRPWAGTTYCPNQLYKGRKGSVTAVDDIRNEIMVDFGAANSIIPGHQRFSSDTVFDVLYNVSMKEFNNVFGRVFYTNQLFRRELGPRHGILEPPKDKDPQPGSRTPNPGTDSGSDLRSTWNPRSKTPPIHPIVQSVHPATLAPDSIWHRIASVPALCDGKLLVQFSSVTDDLTDIEDIVKYLRRATGWIQNWHGLDAAVDVAFAPHIHCSKTLINNWASGVRTYPEKPIPIPLAFLQPIPLQKGHEVMSVDGKHRGILKRLAGPNKRAYWDVFDGVDSKAKALGKGKWRKMETVDGDAIKTRGTGRNAGRKGKGGETLVEPICSSQEINAVSFQGSWFAVYERHTDDRY